MHKKSYIPPESNQQLIKRIELEKEFAKYIAKDLMSQRYGITTYCSTDKYDSTLIQKELCDWQNLKKPIESRSYNSITWIRGTNTFPNWLQWGDEACCVEGCPDKYQSPKGSPYRLLVDIPLAEALDFSYYPNESGEAVLYAFSSADGNSPWLTVGQANLPINASSTNLGGAIIVNINGELYFRYHVYMNADTNIASTGANENDQIKFVLVDGVKQYSIYVPNSNWPTVTGSNGAPNIAPAEETVAGCFTCWAQIYVTKTSKVELCDDTQLDCWFCGMVPIYPEDPCGDQPGINFACENDQECIYIEVIDQYGSPIPNYQIILDGELFGATDENGLLLFSIPQASTNNFHTINDCEFCFYTTGGCSQQKITITVNNEAIVKPGCTIRVPKHDCPTEYIDATPVTPNTPDDVNTSWICDSNGVYAVNGCFEIIDTLGTIGYATEAACLENCQPPPPIWRCVQVGQDNCICSQTTGGGVAPNGINTFATEEDCLNCTGCCCNPPDEPDTMMIWRCFKDLTIKYEDPCEQEMCEQIEVLANADVDGTTNLFYTQTECLNAGCGCQGESDPITHYCFGGTCQAVGQDGFIPPFIGPEAQFTSLQDCENLCGASGQINAWENTGEYPNCCVEVGSVQALGANQYATEAECMTSVTGLCTDSSFPGQCLTCLTPSTGVYQWTPDVYNNIISTGGQTFGETLETFSNTYELWNNDLNTFETLQSSGDVMNSSFIVVPVTIVQDGQPFTAFTPAGDIVSYWQMTFYLQTGDTGIGALPQPGNINFHPEITNIVNNVDFKNFADANKLADNYYDYLVPGQIQTQTYSPHGIVLGSASGTTPQVHVLRMQQQSNTFWSVQATFASSSYSPANYPYQFAQGGVIMWLAFTYDTGRYTPLNGFHGFNVSAVSVTSVCPFEEGCPFETSYSFDCVTNGPFIFQINEDTTY